MVVDTSALVAILLNEPERAAYNASIAASAIRLISAASLLEAALVIESRKGASGQAELDRFVLRARLDVVAFDALQAEAARFGWRRFGKGRHPAALNFGDCFSYALAKCTGEPLLFKGTDFSMTDIVCVPS
ncbi:type II toxin-antitoxin system VapC family toxin [Iodidimonas sp. SYSU 1G8]|uniref:type II toxin-antitoxin system VapC family toxin n=1 Tax=Iodidimonas sp. SYSU 1G8 TaxID=3133967 RepID=UPI0031FECC76